MKYLLCSVSILFFLCIFAELSFAGERFPNAYLLHFPALGRTNATKPLLVYWSPKGNTQKLHSMWPRYCFFSETVPPDWRKEGELPSPGLVINKTEKGSLSMSGTLLGVGKEVAVFFDLELKSGTQVGNKWRGNALVQWNQNADKTYRSEWGLIPAPDSVVYGYAIKFLNEQIQNGKLPKQATIADTVKALKKWPLAKPTRLEERIRPNKLIELAIEEIKQGRIAIHNGKAKCENVPTEDVSDQRILDKYFNFVDDHIERPESPDKPAEPRYKPNERKFVPEGTPQGIRSSRRLRQEEYKSIWNVRNDLKLTKDYSKDKNYLDFTKAELKWAPGIVLLAEHLASIPKDTAKKVAEDYIEDGSAEWFDNLHYKELAVIPSPVFLVACLPHMETEQAKKLAGTERVKKLLDASSITIEEIAYLSFPALTAKLIRNFKPSELQRMLDLTPEFKEYLKKLKNQGNEKITEIVEHKDLNLSRKGDRAKQLGHRLTEQVIPKMIKALQQAKQEEGGSAQDMIDPLFDYMKPRSSIHLAVKDVWEEPEGLRELSQRVILRLEKARKQRPELDSSGEYLNAVFHLKNESAEVKFRYVPNLGSIKWQLLRCGE